MEYYVQHHGIKGQKWGIRRFQNEDGSWTELGKSRRRIGDANYGKNDSDNFKKTNRKAFDLYSQSTKRAIKIGAAVIGGSLAIAGGLYLYKAMGGPSYKIAKINVGSPLSEHINDFSPDNSVLLKPGTVLHRVSGEAIEDYTKNGETYVSFILRDNARYTNRIPKENYFYSDVAYIHRIKSNKEIRAPSSRQAAEIFLKLNPDSTHDQYTRFMTYGIRSKDSVTRSEFVKELNKMGFNAVIDENDYGWTKRPLIILNPSEVIDNVSSHKLSSIETVLAKVLE